MIRNRSFVPGSIAELLAAVAAGVRDAQEALSATPPLDAWGRPAPTYHLPHVEFEFRVDFEARASSHERPVFLIRPASTETESITSIVSGRLVAVPPGDGRPLPALDLTAEPIVGNASGHHYLLRVTAANSAGELLEAEHVQLNLDVDATRLLSVGAKQWDVRTTDVRFGSAVLVTERGLASTELTIGTRVPAGALVMITAELGTASTSLALTNRRRL